MKIFRSLWSLFTILSVGGFLFLVLLINHKSEMIENDVLQEQKYFTEIILNTTDTVLNQYESILTILGTQLLKTMQSSSLEEKQYLLLEALKQSPTLLGFGLFGTNGDPIIMSHNIDRKTFPNMLVDPQTKETFQASLDSKQMIVGRTYYVAKNKQWIIPLRKAITDDNGKVLGVMAAGVKLHSPQGFLENIDLIERKIVIILKDFDSEGKIYRQYYSKANEKIYNVIYNNVLPMKVYHSVDNTIRTTHGMSLDEMRTKPKVLGIKLFDPWGQELFAGLAYSKKYKLWMLVETPTLEAKSEFKVYVVLYSLSYLLTLIIIFLLFLYIYKEEKVKKDALLFQATHDNLTKLVNRKYMYENVDIWKGEIEQEYYVLYIDLDNFKDVNDNYGHQFGDAILIEVSKRLSKHFSGSQMIVRQGGDEFIVLSHKGEREEDKKTFEAVVEILAQPYLVKGVSFRIGASVGVAEFPKDAKSLGQLLSLSDISMYEAKKTRNACLFFNQSMHDMQYEKVEMEQALKLALKNDEIYMVYQPQVNNDGSLYGIEALVRWESATMGLVPPDKFIPIAENSGFMKYLGPYIIERSIEEIYTLQMKLDSKLHLSVNLSVKQLEEEDFLEHLENVLKDKKCVPSQLSFEITESLFIEDIDKVLPLLHKIKNLGIGLSLDDFGTGFSSLSILRRLPVDELKIDKSFVDDILSDKEDAVLTQSIIDVGRNLKMKIVAEGTETKEQVTMLKEMNCDIFQGYYFSKPLKLEALEAFILESFES